MLTGRQVWGGAAVLVALGNAAAAFAQGCPLCYTTVAAARPAAIQALRSGILVLLVPPLLMFIGIFVLAFRSRESLREEDLRDVKPAQESRGRPLLPSPPQLTDLPRTGRRGGTETRIGEN